MSFSIDLFCRVVDNYGDIGVCWRLARQLALAHPVRLIVDDLKVFKQLEPHLDDQAQKQTLNAVTILRWQDSVLLGHLTSPADAVIEAFACELPAYVIKAMRDRKVPPVWIDLEYLSAESWIDTCHAVPSLHPETGLTKTLFFPGFTLQSGGLPREADLIAGCRAFIASETAQGNWRARWNIPQKIPGTKDVSLFCYPGAPVERLFQNLPGPVRFFVPEQQLLDRLTAEVTPGGPVTVQKVPFLPQADYDRLLWTCDVNFVRGEDSWVRAIWAGRPFVWQPYAQAKDAHLIKLQAFLERYLKGLSPKNAETLADLHAMWNQGGREAKADAAPWHDLLTSLPIFQAHALGWSDRQAEYPDCAATLRRFIHGQLAHTP